MDISNLESGNYRIKIIKTISYMPPEKYEQVASYNSNNKRFYVKRGSAGGISIGLKSVEVLEKVN
jgi:hypothetical protein